MPEITVFLAALAAAETNRNDCPLGKWGWQFDNVGQRDSLPWKSVSGAEEEEGMDEMCRRLRFILMPLED